MKVLGLTSAIKTIGASVVDGHEILSECSVRGQSVQSEKLIVLVEELLNTCKIKMNDLDAVSVTIGPGSYSGLRGGLATAKGLVEALKIPIIPVSTLHAVAYNLINSSSTIAVAVNAMRDEYNFALFASNNGKLKRLTKDLIVKLDKITEVINKINGRIIMAVDERVKDEINNLNIMFADQSSVVAWARNVALIGLDKLENKETSDHLSLSPEYSHMPNIREFSK